MKIDLQTFGSIGSICGFIFALLIYIGIIPPVQTIITGYSTYGVPSSFINIPLLYISIGIFIFSFAILLVGLWLKK